MSSQHQGRQAPRKFEAKEEHRQNGVRKRENQGGKHLSGRAQRALMEQPRRGRR